MSVVTQVPSFRQLAYASTPERLWLTLEEVLHSLLHLIIRMETYCSLKWKKCEGFRETNLDCTSLGDDERSGRPNTATIVENIAKVHQMVLDNHRTKVRDSREGKSIACSYECKFIETSAAINHNVDELLVGVVSQIRLKHRQKEKEEVIRPAKVTSPSTSPFKKGSGSVKGSLRSSLRTKGIINRLLGKSGRSKSCDNLGAAWDSLRSGKFLHLTYPPGSFRYSNNLKKRASLHQKEPVNSLKNQSQVTFCYHLRSRYNHRVADLLQSASSYTISTSTSSSFEYELSYHLWKQVGNEDFQQDWCSQNLLFSAICRKTSWKNLPERKKFHAAPLSGLPDDF
ncbi:GTP-binding protein GEM [Trichonephila clavipes]|nr:GTP-binding protein GEM [Trichonephila clavipes]